MVAEFNKFAIDFTKQLVELLWPVVQSNGRVKEKVSQMTIGEVFLKT